MTRDAALREGRTPWTTEAGKWLAQVYGWDPESKIIADIEAEVAAAERARIAERVRALLHDHGDPGWHRDMPLGGDGCEYCEAYLAVLALIEETPK